MEIKEWLRSLGDRARLLIVIPLVAGSLAALVTLVGPSSYESSATVIIAEDPASGSLTSVMAQRVADFTAAVRSDGVLDAVSAETDVARGDLGSVAVTRSGSSGVVTVTFASTRAEDVELVAEAVARVALRTIAQARVDAATGEVTAAQATYDEATKALRDRQAELGEVYSLEQLEDLQRQLIDLGNRADAAAAAGDADLAQDLSQSAERKAARIVDMQELQQLSQTVGAAIQVYFGAQDRLAKAQGSLTAAEDMAIAVTRFARQSKLQEAARRFLFVAAIGFFVALGLVILLQVMDRRREQGERGAVGPVKRPAA